jgi:hypothetical protein
VKCEKNRKNTEGVNIFQEITDIVNTKVKGANWISDPSSFNCKRRIKKENKEILPDEYGRKIKSQITRRES